MNISKNVRMSSLPKLLFIKIEFMEWAQELYTF